MLLLKGIRRHRDRCHQCSESRHRHVFVFVGGLHRSGTSLITRCIGQHPKVSCLRNTNVPEDEGQHLQDLYPTAYELGGPGAFGFSLKAHMTEAIIARKQESREQLVASWKPFWDWEKPVLVEKSPPNLVRTRFLQCLFPNAHFIMMVRHPIAVSAATRKWTNASVRSLLQHWIICHEQLLHDAPKLKHILVIRYEDFIFDPATVLSRLFRFVQLRDCENSIQIRKELNEKYFQWWRNGPLNRCKKEWLIEMEAHANAFGYTLMEPNDLGTPSPQIARLCGL